MSNNNENLYANEINDIVALQNSVIEFPTISIFGKKIDKDNLIITGVILVMWTIIWVFFGFFKIHKNAIFFYILFIILSIVNSLNLSEYIRVDPETEEYNYQRQINNIAGTIGIFVLLLVFVFNLSIDENVKILVSKILTVTLIISCLAIYIYTVKYETRNFKILTLLSQKFFNQSIVLFMLALYIIYTGLNVKNNQI